MLLRDPGICKLPARSVQLVWSRLDRIVQQHPIAAEHHSHAVAGEPANLILARVAFPILFRSPEAEQDFSDAAIALAALARVERAQRQNMKTPKLRRHGTKIAARRTAAERAVKPLGCVAAQIVKSVHHIK